WASAARTDEKCWGEPVWTGSEQLIREGLGRTNRCLWPQPGKIEAKAKEAIAKVLAIPTMLINYRNIPR
ncbi:MAG: hypothetical protein ABIH69_03055, partial [bacterium]